MQPAGLVIAKEGPDDEATPRHMRGAAWSGDRFTIILGIITIVGLIGRVAYVIWQRHEPIGADGTLYHLRAHALADGHGFINPFAQFFTDVGANAPPDAHNPPAWPLILALPSRLGLRSTLSHQLVACVIGGLTIVMSGLAGRAAFGRRVGLIAAGIVALYPNVWLPERELMPEAPTLLGVAVVIWLAYRFLGKPGPLLAFAIGAVVGALALTRSEELALLAFLVLPLIVSAREISWQRRAGWLALAGVGCALFLVPWTAYNTTRFEKPVVLSTGLGAALKSGNCDDTYRGELLGYYTVGLITGCNVVETKLSSDQSVADGQLRDAAFDYMRANKSRVPVVAAARIGRTFDVFRPFQQVHLDALGSTSVWVLRLGLFAYWLLIPFAIYGAVVARRRKIPIYPLLAFPAVVVVAVAFTIGAPRYRAPAEIALALLAAVALDVLATRRRATSSDEDATPEPIEARR